MSSSVSPPVICSPSTPSQARLSCVLKEICELFKQDLSRRGPARVPEIPDRCACGSHVFLFRDEARVCTDCLALLPAVSPPVSLAQTTSGDLPAGSCRVVVGPGAACGSTSRKNVGGITVCTECHSVVARVLVSTIDQYSKVQSTIVPHGRSIGEVCTEAPPPGTPTCPDAKIQARIQAETPPFAKLVQNRNTACATRPRLRARFGYIESDVVTQAASKWQNFASRAKSKRNTKDLQETFLYLAMLSIGIGFSLSDYAEWRMTETRPDEVERGVFGKEELPMYKNPTLIAYIEQLKKDLSSDHTNVPIDIQPLLPRVVGFRELAVDNVRRNIRRFADERNIEAADRIACWIEHRLVKHAPGYMAQGATRKATDDAFKFLKADRESSDDRKLEQFVGRFTTISAVILFWLDLIFGHELFRKEFRVSMRERADASVCMNKVLLACMVSKRDTPFNLYPELIHLSVYKELINDLKGTWAIYEQKRHPSEDEKSIRHRASKIFDHRSNSYAKQVDELVNGRSKKRKRETAAAAEESGPEAAVAAAKPRAASKSKTAATARSKATTAAKPKPKDIAVPKPRSKPATKPAQQKAAKAPLPSPPPAQVVYVPPSANPDNPFQYPARVTATRKRKSPAQ